MKKELLEFLPKPLAKAFRNSIEVPRGEPVPNGYGDIRSGYYPDIDFDKSSYNTITPSEALEAYKNKQSENIIAVFDDHIANIYLDDDGKKKYKYKCDITSKQIKNRSGNWVRYSNQLSPKDFYENADAIYVADEVDYDSGAYEYRRENPESRRQELGNYYVQRPLPAPRNSLVDPNRVQPFPDEGMASYKNSYIRGIVLPGVDSNTHEWTGDPADYGSLWDNRKYPLEVWERVRDEFLKKWGSDDSDYKAVVGVIKLLSNHDRDPNKGPSPLDYNWEKYDAARKQRIKARYYDQWGNFENIKSRYNSLNQNKNNTMARRDRAIRQRDSFASPSETAARRSDLKDNIDRIKDQINDRLKRIFDLELELDNIDTTDAATLAGYEKDIQQMENEISEYQAQMDKMTGRDRKNRED